MPSTEPSHLCRYALTNETLERPLVAAILHYPSREKAKRAFKMSWAGRPQAPKALKALHWDGAHRWPTDICLLKDHYVVVLYDLPPDLSEAQTRKLLEALADNLAQAEDGAASGSQPIRSETNSTSSAAGSRR